MNYRNYKVEKRKKFILCSALGLVLALLLGGIFLLPKVSADQKGYRTVVVVETSGVVTVVKDEISYSAYPGMLLQEDHVLVTAGESTARLVLDGDKYVKVESGSRLKFETLGLLGSGKTALRLERGALTSEIVNPLQSGEEFVVNTPNAVLAVRGTFFRVDLEVSRSGEVLSKVITYGGQVATKRVFPSGEVEELEAMVDAGFKTAINMDKDTTVYVIEETDQAHDTSGDGILNVEPIQTMDISDTDLVDMYYASENGHELFTSTEEIKEVITERNIDLETTTSVYQKASSLAIEDVSDQLRNVVVDDSIPLAVEPEKEQVDGANGENTNDEASLEEERKQTELPQTGVLTDGAFKEEQKETVHVHVEEKLEVKATCLQEGYQLVKCMECGEELSRTVLPAMGHEVEINEVPATCTENGTKTEICTACGEVLSEVSLEAKGHTGSIERTEATCTQDGVETEICAVCNEVLAETILVATGHESIVNRTEPTCVETGLEKEECTVCGEVLSEVVLEAKGHSGSVTRVEGTCEAEGYEREFCSVCGVLLSQATIPMGDHRTEFVGTEFEHSKCGDCGITLVTTHTYTQSNLQELTCTVDGIVLYECECGYSYEETTTAQGHVRDTGDDRFCSNCGELWASLNSTYFPDAAFLAHVSQYDADGDGELVGSELSDVTTLNVAGSSSQDGGYSDLTGIKYFANLTTLNCSYNAGITGLELQDNDSLEILTCGNTGLSWLQLSDSRTLRSLNVFACPIQELLLADQTALTSVNVYNCTSLEMLDISNTAVTTIDVSTTEALAWLDVSGTRLTQVDATNLIQLVSLDASGCSMLETLSAEACDLLGDINLTGCTSLANLSLIGCSSLTSVDFSDCTQLYELNVSNTGLTSLDVSGLTSLYSLGGEDCADLTTVNASGCTSLYTATVARNEQLSTVDVSGNVGLYGLTLTGCTGLTSVNVANCGTATGSGMVIYVDDPDNPPTSIFEGMDSADCRFAAGI